MKCRSFPKLALVVLLVIAATAVLAGSSFALACSSKVATGDFSVTSSTDAAHSHSVTVLGKDVDSPPSQTTYTSTVVGGHSHQITLSKADLDAIRNGQSVSVVSTQAAAHTHTWTIKKP